MSLEIKLKEYEEYKNLYEKYKKKGYPLDKILNPKKYFEIVEEKNYTAKKIVNKQILYTHSTKVAKIMRDYYIKEYGETLPIWKLRIMEVGDSMMKDIQDRYKKLREEGAKSSEARVIISQKFFGSD